MIRRKSCNDNDGCYVVIHAREILVALVSTGYLVLSIANFIKAQNKTEKNNALNYEGVLLYGRIAGLTKKKMPRIRLQRFSKIGNNSLFGISQIFYLVQRTNIVLQIMARLK